MSPRTALAVLGHPLRYTLSPALHRAGLGALGLEGASQALPTPPEALGARLAELAAAGCRGVNLTAPLKEEALRHVARASEEARRARSVNTIGFDEEGWWGETTDGRGLLDLLASLGRQARGAAVTLLGAGGAARSLALALSDAGASVTASARRPDAARAALRDLPGSEVVAWRGAEERETLGRARIVINATPLTEDVAPLEAIAPDALVLDLVYAEEITPWVRAARARGLQAYDGVGVLVFQARRSLERWFGRPVEVEPLARAVGWPR